MEKLSNNFVKYADLINVKDADPETDKEKFVILPAEGEYVFGRYEGGKDMSEKSPYLPVRKTVAEKLTNVGKKLKEIDPNYKLRVAYAFREMKIQQEYFEEVREMFKDEQFDDELALYERIHERVAVPTVAGHPTGGAVDVAIYDESKGDILEFGTSLIDLSTDRVYYAAEDISEEARKNRDLLRAMMLDEGFAPYDGEWWHFCYGDKEWAFYYNKDRALYNQVYSMEDLDIEE